MNLRLSMPATLACTALVLFLPILGCRHGAAESTEGDSGQVVVRVVAVERREMAEHVSGLGRCEALPERLAMLTSLIDGRVDTVLIAQGETVTIGQAIVQLDTTVAQADLAEKEAARDSLVAARKLLESLPRPEEQQAAKLAIEDAGIAVARAQSVVDRTRPLRARNDVSEQQMFETEQALAQAKVQQQSAEAAYQVLMLGPRSEAIAEAQAKIDEAQTAVASSQAKLDLHTIAAPIGGVLDSLNCHPGQTLTVGMTVGQVVDSQRVFATAWLPVRAAQRIRPGQSAQVEADQIATSADAKAADSDKANDADESASHRLALEGSVVFVGRVVDPQTGNVPVRVAVDNTDSALAIGQIVDVSIAVTKPSDTLAVPLEAVHHTAGEEPLITVVREGVAVVLKPHLGTVSDGWVAVAGTDLQPGEPVIVEGAYNLPEGTAVTIADRSP